MQINVKSFKSDRKFLVLSYGASHGPLLLRSGKSDEYPTRIDVLILDVRAMEIRSWLEGFEIALVNRDYLRDFRSLPAEILQAGLNAYSISGIGWQGFIVGGNLCVHEDEADFAAPSAFAAASFVDWRADKATGAATPIDTEIEAAARVLFEAGRRHHWWPEFAKTYDEMAATDQIGKDEFDEIVEHVLFAASKARSNRTP